MIVQDSDRRAGQHLSGVSVADQAYDQLRAALVSGRIEPGARLNLLELTREMHVSNTPVRRALARLTSEGLVCQERNRGFFASPLLDTRKLAELYDFRLMVEPSTAGRAARKSGNGHVERVAGLAEGGEAGRDIAFHTAIAEAAGNRLVSSQLATTLEALGPLSRCSGPVMGAAAWQEHRMILVALVDGDADAAAASMRDHLVNSCARLMTSLA